MSVARIESQATLYDVYCWARDAAVDTKGFAKPNYMTQDAISEFAQKLNRTAMLESVLTGIRRSRCWQLQRLAELALECGPNMLNACAAWILKPLEFQVHRVVVAQRTSG